MIGSEFAKGVGPNPLFGVFSFGPNGATNPVISGTGNTLSGGAARFVSSITYSATGIYTIVFAEGFGSGSAFKFFLAAHPDAIADWFEIIQIGAYNATTKTLVIQAHLAGTPTAPAANAATRIHVGFMTNDSNAPS